MRDFFKVVAMWLYGAMTPKQLAFVSVGKFHAAILWALKIRALFCSSIKIWSQLAKVLFIFMLNWYCVIVGALFGSNLPKIVISDHLQMLAYLLEHISSYFATF